MVPVKKRVKVELAEDEALVLFEALSALTEEGRAPDALALRLFGDVVALLEKELPAVRAPDYDSRLRHARLALERKE